MGRSAKVKFSQMKAWSVTQTTSQRVPGCRQMRERPSGSMANRSQASKLSTYPPTHNPRPTTHMHHNPLYLRHEASERQAASTQQLTRQLTAGRMRTAHAASPWVAAHAPTQE